MKKLIPLLLIVIVIHSCRKNESDFLWEKSYGKGRALFLETSNDSGFYACGEMEGHPYFIRMDKGRRLVINFTGTSPGLFSSAWFDTSGYITGGSSEGKMLLMHHNKKGNILWEKLIDAGFYVDYTNLFYSGNGDFLAVGTASPDSSDSGSSGLLFVRFDTTGQVIGQSVVDQANFISARKAEVDDDGNVYLALTRSIPGSKSKASVAKYNSQFQKLWETELFNNSNFAAASLAIKLDEGGNIYAAGKTELPLEGGNLDNSFLVSLTNSGGLGWNDQKKYLENSNEATDLIFNETGDIMMLNKNCFIINVLSITDGSDAGRIRIFSLCDQYNTDALGFGFKINYDKNIILAGSKGGNFYLAVKAAE